MMAPLRVGFAPIIRSIRTAQPTGRFSYTPLPARHTRCYAGSSYGGGEGDPKGENPQEQGANPSAHLEHPGPAPPKVGQGTGGGPTKKGAEGHTGTAQSSSSGKTSASSNGAGGGPQPKIHKQDAGDESTHSDEVKAHNEDYAKRHDRPNEKSADKEDKVDKGYWKG